jgi:hypothetical protein
MSLVRTFLANSGTLSMGPSQDSDRSLSKNIGAAVDGTGKPIQDVKMSDYYESVVDSDNVTQVIDSGNPVAMSDFRNKTGRLTEEKPNTTIDNRNSKILNKYVSARYLYRSTCKISKNACVTGTNRSTKYGVSYVTRFNTTFRNTTQTTVTIEKDLQPVKEIIRAFFQSLFR